ncbi:ABC transporter substrate-binding protein [Nocardioides acrostichi]|uniref:Putative aliphatic sulfonates-binding protein n=1 Tax=Nocardioides acrostichi TaxID=2784339 RepID=A0A930YE13_9ACTN|nr:ABC transporter substrate-binding protein [Nocardioides acrostichi]MBF4163014.1 ABC transporter substrate-binding protein [Nocardioides acrostichi]
MNPPATRSRRTLRAAAGALVLLAAATLSACGVADPDAAAVNDDGSIDLSKVTLHAGDQKGVSAQALLQASGLDDTPYEIDWSTFTSGPPMMEALAAKSIDVAMVGNTPPIFAAASGSEFKVVASARYTAEGDAIVVPKGSDLTSVDDLAGATVAVAPGSSANYNLLGQLAKAGLTLDDIKVVELQPSDALAAFTSGHIDAWATWEPYTSQVQIQDGAKVLVNGDNGVMNGLNFQVASDQALDDPATEAALEDYLSRIQQAQIWSGQPAHLQAWSKVWAQGAGLDPEITAFATKKRPVDAVPIDDEIVASTQKMADAFYDAGVLPKRVDMTDWFSSDFNADATGKAVEAR